MKNSLFLVHNILTILRILYFLLDVIHIINRDTELKLHYSISLSLFYIATLHFYVYVSNRSNGVRYFIRRLSLISYLRRNASSISLEIQVQINKQKIEKLK